METDLYGTFFCSQAVYPVMTKQGGGRVISIFLTLHYRGRPDMAHAAATKAGDWIGGQIFVVDEGSSLVQAPKR